MHIHKDGVAIGMRLKMLMLFCVLAFTGQGKVLNILFDLLLNVLGFIMYSEL